MTTNEIVIVKVLPDKLVFEMDFFFLDDTLLAVPLKQGGYAIIRTKDGSIMCEFNSEYLRFVFHTHINF